jgi:hypothetical protein
MGMEHFCDDADGGEHVTEEKLLQCHFFHPVGFEGLHGSQKPFTSCSLKTFANLVFNLKFFL